jgi:hypothetical protein
MSSRSRTFLQAWLHRLYFSPTLLLLSSRGQSLPLCSVPGVADAVQLAHLHFYDANYSILSYQVDGVTHVYYDPASNRPSLSGRHGGVLTLACNPSPSLLRRADGTLFLAVISPIGVPPTFNCPTGAFATLFSRNRMRPAGTVCTSYLQPTDPCSALREDGCFSLRVGYPVSSQLQSDLFIRLRSSSNGRPIYCTVLQLCISHEHVGAYGEAWVFRTASGFASC